jgi:hypothetical protein
MRVNMSNRTIAIALVLIGYLSAASYYFNLPGMSDELAYRLCPLCWNIDTVNVSPLAFHIRLTLILGTLNALAYSAIGWLIILVAKRLKRLRADSQSAH